MKFPENTARFSWTRHIKNKMMFYNISGAQIMRIFSTPQRREEAIAPGTIGAMRVMKHNVQKKTDNKQLTTYNAKQKPRETELWIMYKINKQQKTNNSQRAQKAKDSLLSVVSRKLSVGRVTMISAWRYPGRTKSGERPSIPEDVIEELEREGVL